MKLEVWGKSLLNLMKEDIPLFIGIFLLIFNFSRHLNIFIDKIQ